MTEREIIKALKWLIYNFSVIENPRDEAEKMCNCINLYCQNALDLINRQKAEIDRLQKEKQTITDNFNCQQTVYLDLSEIIKKQANKLKTAKFEAIKEFEKRLKSKALTVRGRRFGVVDYYDIEIIAKELTEE